MESGLALRSNGGLFEFQIDSHSRLRSVMRQTPGQKQMVLVDSVDLTGCVGRAVWGLLCRRWYTHGGQIFQCAIHGHRR